MIKICRVSPRTYLNRVERIEICRSPFTSYYAANVLVTLHYRRDYRETFAIRGAEYDIKRQ